MNTIYSYYSSPPLWTPLNFLLIFPRAQDSQVVSYLIFLSPFSLYIRSPEDCFPQNWGVNASWWFNSVKGMNFVWCLHMKTVLVGRVRPHQGPLERLLHSFEANGIVHDEPVRLKPRSRSPELVPGSRAGIIPSSWECCFHLASGTTLLNLPFFLSSSLMLLWEMLSS